MNVAPIVPLRADQRQGFLRAEPAQIVLAEPQRPGLFEGCQGPFLLGVATHQVDGAALLEMAIDTFARGTGTDDIDGLAQGAAHGSHGVDPVPTGQCAIGRREQRRTPSTVPTGSTEAGNLSFEDRDAKRRIRQSEGMGGPQAGEAAADNADVDLEIFGESGACRQGERDGLPPERKPCVLRSRSGSRGYIRRHASASTSRSVDAMK